MPAQPAHITELLQELLQAWSTGHGEALDRLMPLGNWRLAKAWLSRELSLSAGQ